MGAYVVEVQSILGVTEFKDPLNGLTKYEYDLADRITKVTDPRGKITTFAYDGFGSLWAQASPDTGTTAFQYDAGGQRVQATRNDGSVTTLTYDGLGRLITVSAAGQHQSFGYDWCVNGKSRICNGDAAGSIVHMQYELDGRLRVRRELTTANGVQSDYWTRYYYNAAGQLNSMTYPNGHAVGYGYILGKLTTMTVNIGGAVSNVVTGATYRPYGPASGWTAGNGLTQEWLYDQNYTPGDQRLTGVKTLNGGSALQNLSVSYNANDEVSQIADGVNASLTQGYSYDQLGRISAVSSPSGNQGFGYDANGNRASHNWNGLADTHIVEAGSNRVSGVSSSAIRKLLCTDTPGRRWVG